MPQEKTSLQQVQQQRLQQRLNPQNVALGRLLEMSVPELEDEVRRQLDDNPALEPVDERDSATDSSPDFDETSDELQSADYASEDDMPSGMSHRVRRGEADPAFDPATIAPDDGDSLIDALMQRLAHENELSDTDRQIARNIIGNIDDNGYMSRPLTAIADDIAVSEGFYPASADMERIFAAIRALDPAGIGATDLRDCLLLQLDRRQPSVSQRTAREIIDRHFDLFSKRHFTRLQARLEISKEALQDALDLIRTLNPRPASALDLNTSSDRMRHITPDLSLDYDAEDDTFTVTLLGDIPELGIEETFSAGAAAMQPDAQNPAARRRQQQALSFIRRKHDDAAAFIGLLKMRAQTLMAIAKAIVERQRSFFISGDTATIRPMILRDIGADTGLDLSVISRATAGKYILTSHGIYALKMFFNERPDADTDVSSHEILTVMRGMIENEDKHSPLSDQALCEALESKGYNLARRTVAKYREKLGFPVARLRKEL